MIGYSQCFVVNIVGVLVVIVMVVMVMVMVMVVVVMVVVVMSDGDGGDGSSGDGDGYDGYGGKWRGSTLGEWWKVLVLGSAGAVPLWFLLGRL